ncbi:ADC synthase [Elsinoe ampelina]|uniref:aminodeoxychorismate synthase n=1 Tax=Elsinoe ampelina TaxID=302913 RepID=A0A6A6G0W0_9PEZI|nr:ADC synthase [Elsinoe ampelina]
MPDRRPASTTAGQRPRFLFLDAYDSFTNNIIALLRSSLQARVTVIKIDDSRFLHAADNVFHSFLRRFDGVVVGPGPGDPHNPDDIGLIEKLWHLPDSICLPILGICLGFQSLILAFGGTVLRLKEPRHGVIRSVEHRGTSLFETVGEVRATQYHSLHGRLGHDLKDLESLWVPSSKSSELEPLAWDLSDADNGPVLMAVRHSSKPLWGVQYHPESICTSAGGAQVVENWWRESEQWRRRKMKAGVERRSSAGLDSGYVTDTDSTPSTPGVAEEFGSFPGFSTSRDQARGQAFQAQPSSDVGRSGTTVRWKHLNWSFDLDLLPSLCELIREATGKHPLLLESGTKGGQPVRAETGRYSVLGLVEEDAETLKYWSSARRFERRIEEKMELDDCNVAEAFDKLRACVSERRAVGGPAEVPFWGGLVGYISYEAGLETIDVAPSSEEVDLADICFVFVRRTLVIDHVKKRIYVLDISEDARWLDDMFGRIDTLVTHMGERHASFGSTLERAWKSAICRPEEKEYCEKVAVCQSHIRAGDSYELCLTDQSTLSFEKDERHAVPDCWKLYSHLRLSNPAPFGAFLDFEDASILSSSPERFLSWSRDGLCEFRPIKGTVQKGSGMTREKAEEILRSEKEQAENLMIVDLIRHDLNGVVGLCDGSAEVPKLMQVEEYATVFQLVSVIRGQLGSLGVTDAAGRTAEKDVAGMHDLPSPSLGVDGRDGLYGEAKGVQEGLLTGVDVLHASLPPGSMTGAPKKRSCELLKEIEGRRRRIYSGVLGYLDVGGGGDFSVVIRSAIRYRDGWRIGAGGAVTGLSDPLAEFQEMMGKSMAVQF